MQAHDITLLTAVFMGLAMVLAKYKAMKKHRCLKDKTNALRLIAIIVGLASSTICFMTYLDKIPHSPEVLSLAVTLIMLETLEIIHSFVDW